MAVFLEVGNGGCLRDGVFSRGWEGLLFCCVGVGSEGVGLIGFFLIINIFGLGSIVISIISKY